MKLSEAIAATAEVLGTDLSPQAIAMMVEDLSEHPSADVDAALARCRREVRGRLTLADILARLPVDPKAPPTDPDAAWEIAMQQIGNASEALTIITFEAILVSWPYSIWDEGDKVAARMAFKAAYPANLAKFGAQISISDGHDREHFEAMVLEAAKDGRIPASRAANLVPHSDEARALMSAEAKRIEAKAAA